MGSISCCVVTLACAGFDRHLLGLYLIAKEEGRPTPDLFLDPLYAKRYCVESSPSSNPPVFLGNRSPALIYFQ